MDRPRTRISVMVKPNARHTRLARDPRGTYILAIKAPPIEGRANTACIAALADWIGVKKSAVRLVSGARARRKIFEISGRTPAQVEQSLAAKLAPDRGGSSPPSDRP